MDSGSSPFCRIGLMICAFAICYVPLQPLKGLVQAALRQRTVRAG